MSKRITFQADQETTIDEIDYYARTRHMSRSAVISFILNAHSSRLKNINDHYRKAQILEHSLVNTLQRDDYLLPRSQKNIAIEEYLHNIWVNIIKHENAIIGREIFKHTRTVYSMGKEEIDGLKAMVETVINSTGIEKAVLIYTDRRVSHNLNKAGGFSKILMIKKSEHEGFFFDFANSQAMPTFDLITYGIKDSLAKNNISPSINSICWIPIYYINEITIMTPIIKSCDIKKKNMEIDRAIIINPFSHEVRM